MASAMGTIDVSVAHLRYSIRTSIGEQEIEFSAPNVAGVLELYRANPASAHAAAIPASGIYPSIHAQQLTRMVRDAVAVERDACAAIAGSFADDPAVEMICKKIVAEIRNRK